MILIIENDPKKRFATRHEFFLKFGLNTCGAATDGIDEVMARCRVSAAYIPFAEALSDPIAVCRAFKEKNPEIPLIAAVPKGYEGIDLDALYAVTDNIPLRPLPTVKVAEIICELIRIYTGGDRLEQQYAGFSINIYTTSVFYGLRACTVGRNGISILRHLFAYAPSPITAEELARCTCTPINETRSLSCIRMQIKAINTRAEAILGVPIIQNIRGRGYTVSPRR
ncbi:MAG: hypothetical protein J6V07_00370 [Clostridia bacterium]|nr:hypothetical protein [Clostridia bacterium]